MDIINLKNVADATGIRSRGISADRLIGKLPVKEKSIIRCIQEIGYVGSPNKAGMSDSNIGKPALNYVADRG